MPNSEILRQLAEKSHFDLEFDIVMPLAKGFKRHRITNGERLLILRKGTNNAKRAGSQDHPSIPEWEYFRYNVLPDEMASHRKTLERMIIRDFASVLESKEDVDSSIRISEYRLANEKIDLK